MIHATDSALDKLEPLLKKLRSFPSLKERGRGIFYLRSSAFLHFHEDANGLFADVKIAGSWNRHAVNSTAEQATVIKVVGNTLSQ